MNQIYPQVWIQLPKDVREKLVEVFSLPKTGTSEVRDQEVVSDGHAMEDLKGITLEKMRAYIGSEETFGRAWEITLAKVHAELNPPVGEIQNINNEPTIVIPFCDTCDSKGVRHKKECPKFVAIK